MDLPLIRISNFLLKSISFGLTQTSSFLTPVAWILIRLLRLLVLILSVAGLRFLPDGSTASGAIVRPGRNSRITIPLKRASDSRAASTSNDLGYGSRRRLSIQSKIG